MYKYIVCYIFIFTLHLNKMSVSDCEYQNIQCIFKTQLPCAFVIRMGNESISPICIYKSTLRQLAENVLLARGTEMALKKVVMVFFCVFCCCSFERATCVCMQH